MAIGVNRRYLRPSKPPGASASGLEKPTARKEMRPYLGERTGLYPRKAQPPGTSRTRSRRALPILL